MQLYNIKNPSERVSLKTAVLQSIATDGGLYMPTELPRMTAAWLSELPSKTFPEIAVDVARALVDDAIPEAILQTIVRQACDFEVPLQQLDEKTYVVELFHGPTLAFKDFGARFMARLMSYFREADEGPLTILVATSGDTGSAVAQGFLDVEGVSVVVLYPKGLVSAIQERQFATLGRNITALQVDGTFDDCQRLVKTAFADSSLRPDLHLTSANSINIARLIPQSFYYFHAVAELARKFDQPTLPSLTFSVPSGNFGNLTAGLLARRMGLPISTLIAATNRNRVVPRYLDEGIFEPQPSIATIANAMDVGDPNNFVRMLELFEHSQQKMKETIYGASFNDDAIEAEIARVYKQTGYILDPHTAIGVLGVTQFRSAAGASAADATAVVLGTAHPAKFAERIEPVLGTKIEIPEQLATTLQQPLLSVPMSKEYESFRSFLRENLRK